MLLKSLSWRSCAGPLMRSGLLGHWFLLSTGSGRQQQSWMQAIRRRSRSRRSTLPTSASSQTYCCQVSASLAQCSRRRAYFVCGRQTAHRQALCAVRDSHIAQPASSCRSRHKPRLAAAHCCAAAALCGVLTQEPAAVVAPEWLACFPARERAALFNAFFDRAPAPALLRALVACAPAAPPPAPSRPWQPRASRRDGQATDCAFHRFYCVG